MGVTNRGKKLILEWAFRLNKPSNFYVLLATSAVTPTEDTNIVNDIQEIAAGNGYSSGGQQIPASEIGFPILVEDDTANRGYIKVANLSWTASGGNLPPSGLGARYAILTDDADPNPIYRNVIAFWDLGSDIILSPGQTLELNGLELRLNEP